MKWRAEAVSCTKRGDGKFEVLLSDSYFRKRGGGQPGDRGKIGKARVFERVENKHITDKPVSGEVLCEVDLEYRKKLSVLHTAEHLLTGCILHFDEKAKILKADMGNKNIVFSKEISFPDLIKAEELANKKIKDDLSVKKYVMSKKEAGKLARIKEERVPEKVTVVEIDDFDYSCCSGSHVDSLSELGLVKITNVRNSGGMTTVSFEAGKKAEEFSRKAANSALEISLELNSKIEDLPAAVHNILSEKEDYEESLSKLSRDFTNAQKEKKVFRGIVPCFGKDIIRLQEKFENCIIISELDNSLLIKGPGKKKVLKVLKEKFGGGAGGKDFLSGKIKNFDREKLEKHLKHFSFGESWSIS